MAEYGFPDNPGCLTTSRLRRWWLCNIRGYAVLETRHYFHNGWFGRVVPGTVYLMAPRRLLH